jgi:uncharacterized protein
MIEGLERIGARVPVSLTRDGVFQFGGVRRAAPLLVSRHDVFAWTAPHSLSEEDILRFVRCIAAGRADFLLLGTGRSLKFPSPGFRAEIDRANLGLDVMDTAAACDTYNVLIAEARIFAAALLPLAHGPGAF